MPTAHLIYGYLGAGKTTFAKELERNLSAVRFTPDEWMVSLFGENPPADKFAEYHTKIQAVIDEMWRKVLGAGTDVILDFGFWQRIERDNARIAAESLGATAVLYHLHASDAELLARCLKRNESLQGSLVIEENTFNVLRARFEPLDADELATHIPP